MADHDNVIARLRSQMSRGEVVLFLGAGFSTSALDSTGQALPNGRQLTQELSNIAFPNDPFDERTRLADAFYAARGKHEAALRTYLSRRLMVDAERLDLTFRTWFSMPWHRCYTLNLDDLEVAASRRFNLPRPIRSVSATSGKTEGANTAHALEVVHLNGVVWDTLDSMTFSDADYASRLVTPSTEYTKCAVDIVSRPVIFVGTELHESLLWQYLEFRKTKGGRGVRELRPGSCLICPSLPAAREYFLRELNIDWLRMTADQFAVDVLPGISAVADEGLAAIRLRERAETRSAVPHLVSHLAAESLSGTTEYLMGHEPTWPDIHSGRAIQRGCDAQLYALAKEILTTKAAPRPLVVSGTAGAGKSSTLMRLALRLTAEGLPVYWIDERSNIDPHRLRTVITDSKGPLVICVDDADMWGRVLSGWARELPDLRASVLFACAVRTTKVEGLLDVDTLGGIQVHEFAMPPLTDGDIEDLVAVLDTNNRLGILKGRSHDERVEAFRRETGAGRQLLVAMIQATSGVKFRQKVFEEFRELSERQRLLYGILCFVHAQRYSMQREELLLASGAADNDTLNAIETLVRRHLILRDDVHSGYRARHRVVAEELVEAAEFRPFAASVLDGLCFAFANRVHPAMSRSSRPWRRLIRFMNHAYILRVTTTENGRAIYSRIEPLLTWDYHYWLQRGSLEVEAGDLDLATQFLDQARSLMPDNRMIETEYGYLLMKKATRTPTSSGAEALFNEGFRILEALIASGQQDSAYPYHVIGSQGLGWARHARLSTVEKRALLQKVMDMVKEGLARHPLSRDLKALAEDLRRDWLSTTIPN